MVRQIKACFAVPGENADAEPDDGAWGGGFQSGTTTYSMLHRATTQ